MQCEWGYEDCINEDLKCYLCSTPGFHYQSKVKRKQQIGKASNSGRMGSGFEDKNHIKNVDLINGVTSRMTPNSGAGQVKGDEEIRGIIKIMEELKEQNSMTSKGVKTFSMQKAWFEKLDREASAANKQFWYLKFCFGEHDDKYYVALDYDMIMSMVYTMVQDRKAKTESDLKTDLAEKRYRQIEAESIALKAEIEAMKAEIALLKHESEKEF
jgi:hypothetical protein